MSRADRFNVTIHVHDHLPPARRSIGAKRQRGVRQEVLIFDRHLLVDVEGSEEVSPVPRRGQQKLACARHRVGVVTMVKSSPWTVGNGVLLGVPVGFDKQPARSTNTPLSVMLLFSKSTCDPWTATRE